MIRSACTIYADGAGRTGRENAQRIRAFVEPLLHTGLRIRDASTWQYFRRQNACQNGEDGDRGLLSTSTVAHQPNGRSASISSPKTVKAMSRAAMHMPRFELTLAELHSQNGYRVRFNDNPIHPQIIELLEKVQFPKRNGWTSIFNFPPCVLRRRRDFLRRSVFQPL